ncbi:MAG TPA: LPS export ABC transporter ATP-binding protein [candidate division WOR-3 bacterium]|uniref:LPS export ABC transporter ATP-binding protein n=1 Tax=candidate division WOR-3 bacterium TaxID=2052148 RepID=A0A7V0LUL1_UNCW3|nr:MAG: LPS export ABC transporter ATP-binding protein [Candidatus Hydrothermae bacterium]HDL60423.1 LPS export ABC transporter ATP-binding protein [candidate division WOR-3 bacterium]
MSVLKAIDLKKKYGKKIAVNGISLEVKTGEVVGLLGPNGAGKTTTFYMIMGALKPDHGNIFLDDMELTHFPMYKRAQMGVSYLPQEASVFRKLTVFENIYSILELKKTNKEEAAKKTQELLNLMGIDKLKNEKAYNLSGGERRRVEIARSLAITPKFLLLDEPFTGIDPKTREEIQDIIINLKNLNIGILITDHNVRETLSITDRAYIIYQGEILIEGTSQELINNPEARKIYLGERFKL